MDIKIEATDHSRIGTVNFDNLEFGRTFSDHMLEMIWKNGSWSDPVIRPYGPIEFTPALNVLHYGQEIFEGMKAYYVDEHRIHLFRPDLHHARFTRSCQRLCMPEISYETFLSGLEALLRLDHAWIPKQRGRALYIRPVMFASEEFIAAVESSRYNFYFITCPVAAYYKEGFNPVSLTTTDTFVRAVRGGTGEAKTGGNYAAGFLPAKKAREKGYSQILWLDAIEKKYVEEVGTMNIFFKIDGTLVTPELSGSVLNGITRRSVIDLAQDRGLTVEERKISIDEVFDAADEGRLEEVFGSGTAAVISPVKEIHHNGRSIKIGDGKAGEFSLDLFDTISDIQYGQDSDPYGWTHEITL
ncbi:MAG: branched-chain amino acid aminotransferase [Balneolaceae bacterium]